MLCNCFGFTTTGQLQIPAINMTLTLRVLSKCLVFKIVDEACVGKALQYQQLINSFPNPIQVIRIL